REKAQKENELKGALEAKNKQGESYEKEIEIVKFHEERGKIKCSCYDCKAKKEIKNQIQREMLGGPEKKVECPECGKRVKVLDEEN
ncbi:12788_t:CDS:1, partial [Entrophospora sp. SA101]